VDAVFHVRLAGSDPDIADQYILKGKGVRAGDREDLSPIAGRDGRKINPPVSIRRGDSISRLSWRSKPSTVNSRFGTAMTPALLIRMSRGDEANWAAKARTELRSAKSSTAGIRLAAGRSWRIRAAASSALSMLREARTTSAPLRANSSAVCQPMPLLAPVTMIRRPAWEGMSAAVHLDFFMPANYARKYPMAIRHLFSLY
jgi:hypothetical protein